MAKAKTKSTSKAPTPRKRKTFDEKAVARVGKRPVTRNELAAKMGVKPQAVARALGKAHAQGTLVKTDRGYQKAL